MDILTAMIVYGYKLPHFISKYLFGDRKRYGLTIQANDPCWQRLTNQYSDLYFDTQKNGIGKRVNNSGYSILSHYALDNKVVMEVGPGNVDHLPFWTGKPKQFIAVDCNQEFLSIATEKLKRHGINTVSRLNQSNASNKLPAADNSVDLLLSFYSLEHLHPLTEYLEEMNRVLKPGGKLIGAIPLEGGLAWGLGRFLTTRRYIKKHTAINPDKVICWAHPNFANTIQKQLNHYFTCQHWYYWPFALPIADCNLTARFIYEKPSHNE